VVLAQAGQLRFILKLQLGLRDGRKRPIFRKGLRGHSDHARDTLGHLHRGVDRHAATHAVAQQDGTLQLKLV